MNKRLKKICVSLLNYWKLVCAFFLCFTVVICLLAGLVVALNGGNLLTDTSLLFPPLSFMILGLLFGSGMVFIIISDQHLDKIKNLETINNRIAKENAKLIKSIGKLYAIRDHPA